MGKASSSKKVARAARAGGAASASKRRFGFPAAIVLILILGFALIWFARSNVFGAAASEPPVANQDHWHAAYGFYVCDQFLPPLEDAKQDASGIHTHGDGVIHIHPTLASAAGKNATLSKWGEVVGVEFGNDSFKLPNGTTYENGYSCGGAPATLSVYEWANADPATEPTIYTSGFGDIQLRSNGALFTFAVVPEGTEVPRPETAPVLDNLDPTTDDTTAPLDEIIEGGGGGGGTQTPSGQVDTQVQDQIDQQVQDQIDQQIQQQLEQQGSGSPPQQ